MTQAHTDMERFENKHGRIWYIFDRKLTALFEDDYLYLQDVEENFRENKIDPDAPRRTGPSMYIPLLPAAVVRRYALWKALPLSITFKGTEVGYSIANSGYASADLGMGRRRLREVACTFSFAGQALSIDLDMTFCATDPESLNYGLREADKTEVFKRVHIAIPFVDVPEVLNMDEKSRRLFARNCGTRAAVG